MKKVCKKWNKWFDKQRAWLHLVFRVGLGAVFLTHGLGKLLNWGPTAVGIENFAGFLGSLGVPLALAVAWLVALVETFGGLALIVGFGVRDAAVLLAIDMLFAAWLVHWPNGFAAGNGGWELPLILLLGLLHLAGAGAGKLWNLDKKWGCE